MGVFAVLYMVSRVVGTGGLQAGAEAKRAKQSSGADAFQRPLRYRFQARLTASVRRRNAYG